MDKDEFTRYLTVHRHYSDKSVQEVEVKLVADDITGGELRITDIQLQEGSQPTGIFPATEEILRRLDFTIDETYNATSGENVYEGEQPSQYQMNKRFFNVIGRGFETIAIPNVYHEDVLEDVLTTGLDLTLYPKDDYDFLRISTFYGGEVGSETKTYKNDSLVDNPLNKRYTREFCFSGGNAGDEIKLLSSEQKARINGTVIPLGVRRFNVGQEEEYSEIKEAIYQNRQRFMALPVGATRIKIEFMKIKNDDNLVYMTDDEIGFQGLAEFTQWSWGVSKY